MERGGRPHEVLHLPRRNPTPLQSPLSNTLIPRDFLSQRSGAQDLHIPGADSTPNNLPPGLPSTASPDAGHFSLTFPFANMPSIANPHSPRPLHHKENGDQLAQGQREPNVNTRRSGSAKKEGSKRTQTEDSTTLRKVSSPGVPCNAVNQPHPSPPASPRSTNSMEKEDHKIDRVALPRNSSIESAHSSISSSAEHSHKSSNDGSAENLISHLLKDKQHAASQNAQLWKLVDKQRSLLMGLNQDLERAIRDKEKYRRKLKDLQTQAAAPHSSGLTTPEQSQNVGGRVKSGQQAPAKENNTSQAQAPVCTPNDRAINNLNSSPLDLTMMPSPLHLLQGQQKHQVTEAVGKSEVKDKQQMPTLASIQVSNKASVASSDYASSSESHHQPVQATFLKSPSPIQAQSTKQNTDPTSTSMGASPATERAERNLHPTRKPPPAPLNLNQAKPKNHVLQDFASIDHLSSDHEPSQHIQEVPLSQRGRRKTREEDDRDREMAAQQEEAARSRSSKSSKSGKKKSKQELNTEAQTKVASVLPSSVTSPTPRQVAIPPPSEAALNGPCPPSSIAAVLSPNSLAAAPAAPVVERTLTAPPMSPGLPVSPRPIDRPPGSPMPRLPREGSGIPLSPPLSPRGAAPILPLSPRFPGSAIPPSTAPVAVSSPPPSQESFSQPSSPRIQEMPRPTVNTSVANDRVESRESPVSPFHGVHIDRSLMDPAYPKMLLPPRALSSIIVRVSSSRLRPKRQSYLVLKSNDEDSVFTLSIFSRSEGRELWRVEKVIMALPQLDSQMKSVSKFATKLPERKLFSGHSPAIIDARRTALNHYIEELLEAAVDERSALVVCQFLSNDVIEARDDETSLLTPSQRNKPVLALGAEGRPVKEGYLTKRGKNFGGWKVRYFILQGSELKYFEAPGGTHLGTIKLQNAQIGKQTQSPSPSRADDDVENQYRHAFLVLEPKRKDSSSLVRHVLCAESDEERDEWVLVLMQHCDTQSDDERNKQPVLRRAEDGKNHITGFEAKVKQYSEIQNAAPQDAQTTVRPTTDELKVIGYEQVTAGTAPTIGVQQTKRRQDTTPSPASASSAPNVESGSAHDQQAASQSSKPISGPTNGGVIQDAGSWGNKPPPQANVKDKKRSMWGFRQRGGSDSVQPIQPLPNSGAFNLSQTQYGPIRAVFGLPLTEAVELCPPRGVNVTLPAVVYRCIEYLQAKDAASEEGIFRLSGSNLVIKALRERFNTEGDVNFIADDQYYDVHAVASLFKSYLRELPTTVLTKELHLDFLHVLELDEKSKKIAAFNVLVHRLPQVNLALLKALSQYLIQVVNNADTNKMNVRNMGIVFSPTLNIPAPVFSMFLTDFEAIFGSEPAERAPAPAPEQTKTIEFLVPNQLTPEDIRSPRHQIFTDLPTPAYNQTTFSEGPPPAQFPMQQPSINSNPSNASIAQNTGFIPMQPSYETKTYVPDPQVPTQPQQRYSMAPPLAQRAEYGSMNMMLAPSNAATLKAKRRESSMLFMGMGHRKSSVPKLRDDSATALVPNNNFE
ncbi:hypothetical protein GJ744_007570 [Endocarpon pusillum]|uniref:RhoGAP-domain-containing protein n=1 Tax=Endocarpon pusillum TaxID=364733 RepID=A0A8H7AKA9_9EURO|nr:hypothetical protein GJ744_007570 [Endocarpon pusillum]